MAYSSEEQLRMYRNMVLDRTYEEAGIEHLKQGAFKNGTWHNSEGEEAAQTGCICALGPDDYYASTHRCHGALVQLLDPKKFTAESFCKVTGYQRGKAASVHIGDLDSHVLNSNGVLGSNSPIAVGFAKSLALQGKPGAVVSVIGDMASCEGNFAEAVNLAGVFDAPVVFFIENNGIGMTNPIECATRLENLSERARFGGLEGVTVDGTDVEAVREAVEAALEKARKGNPSVVEAKCCRYDVHSFGMTVDGRDPSVIEAAKKNDPIEKYEKKLLASGVLTEDKIAEIKAEVEKICKEAFDFALASDDPTEETTLDINLVYANPIANLA